MELLYGHVRTDLGAEGGSEASRPNCARATSVANRIVSPYEGRGKQFPEEKTPRGQINTNSRFVVGADGVIAADAIWKVSVKLEIKGMCTVVNLNYAHCHTLMVSPQLQQRLRG